MELEWLKVDNFQCHEKQRIRFRDNVTVLVGQTDAGKSAILRAIRWVFTNRPQGDTFIREGAEYCRVQTKVAGKVVTRERGKGINQYEFDGVEFKSFGNSVPDTIEDFLRFTEVNFQGQHDPPFWFTLSPGDVGKQLNAIVDLEVIDKIVTASKRRVQAAKSRVSVYEDEQKQVTAELERLAFVPQMEQEWASVQVWQSRMLRKQEALAELQEALAEYQSVTTEIKQKQRLLESLQNLQQLAESHEQLQLKRRRLEVQLTRIAEVEDLADQPIPDLKRLQKLQSEAEHLAVRHSGLRDLLQMIASAESNRNIVEKALEEATEQLKEIAVCPQCQRPL